MVDPLENDSQDNARRPILNNNTEVQKNEIIPVVKIPKISLRLFIPELLLLCCWLRFEEINGVCVYACLLSVFLNMLRENSGENGKKPAGDCKNTTSTGKQQTELSGSNNVPWTSTITLGNGSLSGSGGDERKSNRQNERNGGCANSHTPKKNAKLGQESNEEEANEGTEQPAENLVDVEETEHEGDNAIVVYEQPNNNRTSITNDPMDTKLSENGQVDFAVRPEQHITTASFSHDKVIEKTGVDQDVFYQPQPNRVGDLPPPLQENDRGEVTEDEREETREMPQPEVEQDDSEYGFENIQDGENSNDGLQENFTEHGPGSSSTGGNATVDNEDGFLDTQHNPIQENTSLTEKGERALASNHKTLAENLLTNRNSKLHTHKQQPSFLTLSATGNMNSAGTSTLASQISTEFQVLKGENPTNKEHQLCKAQRLTIPQRCTFGKGTQMLRNLLAGFPGHNPRAEVPLNNASTSNCVQLDQSPLRFPARVDQPLAEVEFGEPENENFSIHDNPAKVVSQTVQTPNEETGEGSLIPMNSIDRNRKIFPKTTGRKFNETTNESADRILEINNARTPSTSQNIESAGIERSATERRPSVLTKPSGGFSNQNPKEQTIAKRTEIRRSQTLDAQPSTSIIGSNPNPKQAPVNGSRYSVKNSQDSKPTWSPADDDLDTGQTSSANQSEIPSPQTENYQQVIAGETSLGNTDHQETGLLKHADTAQSMEPTRPPLVLLGSMMSYRNATCVDPRDPQEKSLSRFLPTEQPVETSGSSMFFESILQTMRRIGKRTKERHFYHPEGQYTKKELWECWHSGEWIYHCGPLPLCDYCGFPWCQACRRSCGETRRSSNHRDDDKQLKKKAFSD